MVAPTIAPALAGVLAGPSLLAAVCAVFALAWTCATLVAVSGSRATAEPTALSLATVVLAAAIAGSGGLGHPAALLSAGLAFETYWIGRDRRSATIGAAAGLAALPLSVVAAWYLPGAAIGTWGWLVPGLYAATVLPRVSLLVRPGRGPAVATSLHEMAQAFGMASLKITPSGEVIDASDEAGALFGLPAGLLAGRSLFERVHVGDRVGFMNALANTGTSTSRQSVDLRIRVAGAGDARTSERFLPVSMELMADTSFGKGIAILVRDNSALAETREQLEAARRMTDSTEIAKNRFLAAVSHELRTPLNAIIGFSDMMLNDMAGRLTEQQREYVGLISHSGSHLLSVVNAILDVSKIESGAYSIRPEAFAVGEAIDLCKSMMSHQAQTQGLEMIVSVRPDISEIVADRRAVQQIVINLLSNAIKFTPAGGTVSLDAYRVGSKISLVVSDSGIGIAEEDLGRLGKPFTQVSNDITRQFEGAGLGLSLVKGLVALHEGELTIESAPGEGTVVTVALPVDGPKSLQREPRAAMPASATVHAMDLKVRDETVRKTA